MRIAELRPQPDWVLSIVLDDGRLCNFDVSSYLGYEAVGDLQIPSEFVKIYNDGYFVKWDCGADLSADTLEVRWQIVDNAGSSKND